MNYLKALLSLTVALAGVPAASLAQSAYVAKQVNLRAGPGTEYPVVAILMAGVTVEVQGCLSDYRWCDVVTGVNRGWIYGGNIVYPYQGSSVPVINYGAVIGIGIVAFGLASYWDQHYVARPWYPQRQRWINRPPPGHAPRAPLPAHRPPEAEHRAPGLEHRAPPQRPPVHPAPDVRQAPIHRPEGEPRERGKGNMSAPAQSAPAEPRPSPRTHEPKEPHRPPGDQKPVAR